MVDWLFFIDSLVWSWQVKQSLQNIANSEHRILNISQILKYPNWRDSIWAWNTHPILNWSIPNATKSNHVFFQSKPKFVKNMMK